jgi:D-alanine--D-alanine ligase
MAKIRLALIAGGTSAEREVALRGAAGVERELDPDRYEVVRYDPAVDLARIVNDAAGIDVAFLLLHGVHGEDGSIQGLLDLLGIPYQGAGVLGSALAMDKNLAKIMFRLNGLPVAPWVMVEPGNVEDTGRILAEVGLPCVVKPVMQGSSIGMSIVRESAKLPEALQLGLRHDSMVMVEKYIRGRELTVGVLGNKSLEPLPLVEIIPDAAKFEFFNYEAKYQQGASREICPAEVSEAVCRTAQDYAVRVHRCLQLCGYSRTDMILAEDALYVLETNTIPGMTPTSLLPQAAAAAGYSFSALLDRLIELAREKPGRAPE